MDLLFNGTKQEVISKVSPALFNWRDRERYIANSSSTDGLEWFVVDPVEVNNKGVLIKPQFMEVGKLYPFMWDSITVIARKKENNSIDFFTVP